MYDIELLSSVRVVSTAQLFFRWTRMSQFKHFYCEILNLLLDGYQKF